MDLINMVLRWLFMGKHAGGGLDNVLQMMVEATRWQHLVMLLVANGNREHNIDFYLFFFLFNFFPYFIAI